MQAAVTTDFGAAPEVLELDIPEPGQGEVRVRVHAASVNGFDLAVAAGYLKDMMEHRFPVVLGKDFAGTVDALGPGVTGYARGDRVFGVVTKTYLGDGSFAEFVTVPVATGLAKLPESVTFTEGAALGLAGAAALAATDACAPQPGQAVLVVGATGGVGTQVVQLAVKAGAHVIATAHTDLERQHVTELGAAELVDYTGDVAAAVLQAHPQGVDAVIHLAGDPAPLLAAVRTGGKFISTLIGSPEQLPAERATVVPVAANPAPDTLDRLADNQAKGHTSVKIQRVYGLDSAPAALADFAGGTLGKLVIITTN
jgi:NADPH:quinone reductase-like Zn-dependent oxidoreductase